MAPLKKKRIQIRKFPVTQYQADALKQLCPPENITVSEWAENYRVLDSKTSALPGPWRNEKTPYLKEIMDELINYDTERIIFVKPTQVGGTEALQNMLGYVIQQDPSPTMIVYPTDILAKSISENRLEPMIMATRTLKSLYNKNESSQLELQFDGIYLSLAGSNSPSSLASKAIKYLFLDEVDKYPGSSKKESDPISLAMERTKTFRNRKIYMTSTPTLATGHIWKALMDADIEIFDEADAVEMGEPKGEIAFHNVSFEYPDDHNQVFKNLNLTIHPGEKVALVGPSGGGKTTLCNLIPRFYDVTGGEITIDGKSIKHFTLKSLRHNIGIVQQDVYLFSGTIYDNIVYGRPDATREEVMEAAKRAGAHEFITELKDGYDTYVGERGVKLSGGQKQRISIARVFLKNPPIIILDEATSALDNESEYEVAKSLGRLSEGRTTLTIAHRLSSIRNSDRILVLTHDGIVEEGNHEELLEKHGIYDQFYRMANELK